MIVVCGHAAGKFGGPQWWMNAISVFNGQAAVGMFFVLSGFVLTKMLQERPFNVDTGVEFLLRRIFRIYPTLIVANAASLVFVLLYPHLSAFVDSAWLDHEFTAARVAVPFIILAFAGASAHLLPQSWTISIELFGSLLMPAIAWMAFHRRGRLCVILAFAAAVGMTVGPYTPYGVLMYMPHFIVGSLIFTMPSRICDLLRRLSGRNSAVVLATIVMLGLRGWFDGPEDSAIFVAMELACSAFIIAMLVYGGVSFSFLRSRPAEWLGDISYSLYLFHFVVIFFAIVGIRLAETAAGSPQGALTNNLLLMAVVIVVSLPISAASCRFIERPANNFGKRLLHRLPSGRIGFAIKSIRAARTSSTETR